jgi:hypothetical protein
MKFHLPSFLIGLAAGVAATTLWSRFRPALLEIATAAYEAGDALWARAATLGEDAEDLLAEAQSTARARGAKRRKARSAARRARPHVATATARKGSRTGARRAAR